jgi:hypothetical protein
MDRHEEAKAATFEGWALVEIFGHRKVAGMVKDVEMFGSRFCRIDEPEMPATKAKRWTYHYDDGSKQVEYDVPARQARTHFYGASSIFGVTPCTEAMVREFLVRLQRDEAPAVVDIPRLTAAEDDEPAEQEEESHRTP